MARIGTDIEQISRLQLVLERRPAVAPRVFTASERAYCQRQAYPAQHYAARFCAKEAVAKALGIKVRWQEIEVCHNAAGVPQARVSGTTASCLGRRVLRLSLAHAGDYAMAMVLVEEPRQHAPARMDNYGDA